MAPHLRPPATPPNGLAGLWHKDPFGVHKFGPWSRESIIYWFIRLLVLTDPTSDASDIRINKDVLYHSLAALTPSEEVVGGAFNETMPAGDAEHQMREDDPFLKAVLSFGHPILNPLHAQDKKALSSLSHCYPDFENALADCKVGYHFMVARSDDLTKEDTFELVAAAAEHFAQAGYRCVYFEAVNQWTGAALELLGRVRVHYSSFLVNADIGKSEDPLPNLVTSSNGFISDKDSGSMFYVLALGNTD